MSVDERIKELGIELPESYGAIANYVPVTREGNILYLAGTGPSSGTKALFRGRLGEDIGVDEGYEAARAAAVNALAILKQELGSLERVEKILRMTGYINASPDFELHPAVLDGASDLLVEVFGERGRHARAAIGVASLPMRLPVEIELTVCVKA